MLKLCTCRKCSNNANPFAFNPHAILAAMMFRLTGLIKIVDGRSLLTLINSRLIEEATTSSAHIPLTESEKDEKKSNGQ
jgi:hypothetical protein